MKITLVYLALVFTFIISGCSKKKGCTDPISIHYDVDAEMDDGFCVCGGTGGNVTIVGFPQHHGVPIPNQANYPDRVFVKFNAINSLGNYPSDFDVIFVGDSCDAVVQMPGLKHGKYIS